MYKYIHTVHTNVMLTYKLIHEYISSVPNPLYIRLFNWKQSLLELHILQKQLTFI